MAVLFNGSAAIPHSLLFDRLICYIFCQQRDWSQPEEGLRSFSTVISTTEKATLKLTILKKVQVTEDTMFRERKPLSTDVL